MIVHSPIIEATYNPRFYKGQSCCEKYGVKNAEADERVTCEECLKILKCNHSFRFLYEGRHGSDKGNKTYVCDKCSLRFEVYHSGTLKDYIKNKVVSAIFDDASYEQKEAIVMKHFDSF